MRVKKIISYLICVLLAVLLACAACFGLTACGEKENATKPPVDNGKPHLPNSEYDEEGYVDNTPADPGTPVSHVFEAEDMAGDYCAAESEFFDLSFGGSILMRNVGSGYRFGFTSSAAYKITMEIAVTSAFSGYDWAESNLSDLFEIVVNGRTADASGSKVPAGSPEQMRGGNVYTCLQTASVSVSIAKGTNTVALYPKNSLVGIDYIDLKTSAEITPAESVDGSDDVSVTVALPTAESEGMLTFVCDEHGKSARYALPALAEGNGYAAESADGVTDYSFVLRGKEYVFSSDGTYELPEGASLETPAEYDFDDPEPYMPYVNIYGKYFFHADEWQTFTSGSEKGALPAKDGETLVFNDGARFDFFYVSDGVHIADKSTNLKDKSFYGQDYTWKLKMSADKAFTLALFNTKNAYMHYDQSNTNSGSMYLKFDGDSVSLTHLCYSNETAGVVAQADAEVPLDGSEFEVAVTVNRLSDNYLRFGISVDGVKSEFEIAGSPKITSCDSAGNVIVNSSNMYGQRLAFIPDDGGKITVSGVALPYGGYNEPQGEAPELPDLSSIEITENPDKLTYTAGETFDPAGMVVTAKYSDGTEKAVSGYTWSPSGRLTEADQTVTVSYTEREQTKTAVVEITVKPSESPLPPSAVINGKEFFDPSSWTTFGKGSVKGGAPELEGGALVFDEASRFEFFYVDDGMHIGDKASNLKNKDFYNKEYDWTLDMSASGKFSILLFANNNFMASLDEALGNTACAGTYLVFDQGKIAAYHMQYGTREKIGEATADVSGGSFRLGVKAVRTGDNSLKYSLTINGTAVEFAAEDGLAESKVDGSEITLNSSSGNMFGQRICIVPETGSVVTVSGLELPSA